MPRLLLALLFVLAAALPASAGVLFNSSTDRLTTSTFTVPTTGTACLDLYPNWAQTDNTHHQLLWIASASGNDQFEISKFSNNFISAGWQNAAVSYKIQTTSYTLNQNAWNRLCITWDDASNLTRFYINGSQVGSTVSSLVTWDTSTQTLGVGNTPSSLYNLDGRLAEVAFWNRVLTTEELSNRMGGLLSNCITSGLINYWPLVSTSDLTDKAGTENLTNNGVTDAADHPSTTTCGGGGTPSVPTPTVLIGTGATAIDETDAASYAAPAFAMTANKPTLFVVTSRFATAPNIPAITSCHGVTWTQVATQTVSVGGGAAVQRTTVFRSMVTSDSASDSCDVGFSSQTQTRAGFIVVEFAGADTTGTEGSGAIVQSKPNSASASTTLTITFDSAYSSSNNRPICFAAVPESAGDHTMEWTELVDYPSGVENLAHMAQWKDDTTDTSATFTRGASTEWAGVCVEIKAGTVAAASTGCPVVGGGLCVGGIIQ